MAGGSARTGLAAEMTVATIATATRVENPCHTAENPCHTAENPCQTTERKIVKFGILPIVQLGSTDAALRIMHSIDEDHGRALR